MTFLILGSALFSVGGLGCLLCLAKRADRKMDRYDRRETDVQASNVQGSNAQGSGGLGKPLLSQVAAVGRGASTSFMV